MNRIDEMMMADDEGAAGAADDAVAAKSGDAVDAADAAHAVNAADMVELLDTRLIWAATFAYIIGPISTGNSSAFCTGAATAVHSAPLPPEVAYTIAPI